MTSTLRHCLTGTDAALVDPTKISGYVFYRLEEVHRSPPTCFWHSFSRRTRGLMDSGADRIGARLLFAAVIDDPLCFF
jgi:hypothetical protein